MNESWLHMVELGIEIAVFVRALWVVTKHRIGHKRHIAIVVMGVVGLSFCLDLVRLSDTSYALGMHMIDEICLLLIVFLLLSRSARLEVDHDDALEINRRFNAGLNRLAEIAEKMEREHVGLGQVEE